MNKPQAAPPFNARACVLAQGKFTRPGTNLEEVMLREFITVFRLYRRHHPTRYALSRAWGIAVKGEMF